MSKPKKEKKEKNDNETQNEHPHRRKRKRFNRMLELRKSRGLRQREMAAALGVSESCYCSYETCSREPCYRILFQIADLFGVSLDYLLMRKIPGKSCTLSPEDIDILEKFHAIDDPSARKLICQLMDLVRDHQTKEALNFQNPRPAGITIRSVKPLPDQADYARIASRDGGEIREASMTAEQLQILEDLDPLDDEL